MGIFHNGCFLLLAHRVPEATMVSPALQDLR